MDYSLKNKIPKDQSYLASLGTSATQFWSFLKAEKSKLGVVLILTLFNSAAQVLTPFIIALATDQYIVKKDLHGLFVAIGWLAVLFAIGAVTGYLQTKIMGAASQRTLWRLRNTLFEKLQSLPITFFKQNKAGDLMSRLNSDTDKLNQFLSESLIRFVGSFFSIFGIAVFIFFLNVRLALVTLSATLFIFIITKLLSPYLQKTNKRALVALGSLSSEIQEDLSNFKVIAAFNQRTYFEKELLEKNEENFRATYRSSMLNQLLAPIYDFAGNIAQLAVLSYGIWLIVHGDLTIGLLIGFIAYTQRFYEPLRILASIWSSVQTALAAWSRVEEVLDMKTDLTIVPASSDQSEKEHEHVIEFKNVSFAYADEPEDMKLKDINLDFKQGKTYALVGPTGGGKSTTAALMARLYDPVKGEVRFLGRDIRTYSSDELAAKVGFILQDPFLFTGTLGDNLRYGNDRLQNVSNEDLVKQIDTIGLGLFLSRFENGLDSQINDSVQNISLGQKQIISFIRILLREPELFILDEATANVDTVTEALLDDIMNHMPKTTTKVIIAHRLSTIRHADEIIFISGGRAEKAVNFDDAINLINKTKRGS